MTRVALRSDDECADLGGITGCQTSDVPLARRAPGYESPAMPITMGWVLRQDNDPAGARASFQAAPPISRRSGYLIDLAYASLGLARANADLADPRRAAELHGAAQAFLDRMGEPRPEPEARYYRRDGLRKLATSLSQEPFGYEDGEQVQVSPGGDSVPVRTRRSPPRPRR